MGYEAGKSSPKPILKIKAITYRNNPILPFSNMGMPVHEGQTATALIKGAEIYAELKKLGLPVKGVFLPALRRRPYVCGVDGSAIYQFRPAGRSRGVGDQAWAYLFITW